MKQNLLPAVGLFMSLLFGSCTREAGEKTPLAEVIPEKKSLPEVISLSAIPNGKTEIEYAEGGQQYKVEYQGSKITALFINGKKLPEEIYSTHKAIADKFLQQIEHDQLTPPKAKGPEAGQDRIEVVNLISNGAKNGPAEEKKDQEQAERERKPANKSASQE